MIVINIRALITPYDIVYIVLWYYLHNFENCFLYLRQRNHQER